MSSVTPTAPVVSRFRRLVRYSIWGLGGVFLALILGITILELPRHLVLIQNPDDSGLGFDVERRLPETYANGLPEKWADTWWVSMTFLAIEPSKSARTIDQVRLAQRFPELKQLNIVASAIDQEILECLRTFKHLEHLSIGATNLSGDWSSLDLPRLQSLTIRVKSIAPDGLRGIGTLTSLQSLTMSADDLNEQQCSEIESLPNLQMLDLTAEEQFRGHLGRLSNLSALRQLSISFPSGTSIESIGSLPSLVELTIILSDFGDSSLKYLMPLKVLNQLSLSTRATLGKELAVLEKLPRLKHLILSCQSITDDGIWALTTFRPLDAITIAYPHMTEDRRPCVETLRGRRDVMFADSPEVKELMDQIDRVLRISPPESE